MGLQTADNNISGQADCRHQHQWAGRLSTPTSVGWQTEHTNISGLTDCRHQHQWAYRLQTPTSVGLQTADTNISGLEDCRDQHQWAYRLNTPTSVGWQTEDATQWAGRLKTADTNVSGLAIAARVPMVAEAGVVGIGVMNVPTATASPGLSVGGVQPVRRRLSSGPLI